MGNTLHVFQYESVTFSFNVTCPGRVKVSFKSRIVVSHATAVLARVVVSRATVVVALVFVSRVFVTCCCVTCFLK